MKRDEKLQRKHYGTTSRHSMVDQLRCKGATFLKKIEIVARCGLHDIVERLLEMLTMPKAPHRPVHDSRFMSLSKFWKNWGYITQTEVSW